MKECSHNVVKTVTINSNGYKLRFTVCSLCGFILKKEVEKIAEIRG